MSRQHFGRMDGGKETGMSVTALIDEHEAMDRVAGDLLACIARPDYDVDRAVALRSRLAAMLDEHLEAEDTALYPALSAAHDLNAARDLDGELATLCSDWQAYLSDWSGTAGAINAESFARATDDVVQRIRDRIAVEQGCLAVLAGVDASGDPRHRPATMHG